MRAIFALILVAGLGLAAFAANLVRDYMSQQQAALHAERAASVDRVDVVEVYALRHAVGYGHRIGPDDLGLIQYAAPFVPEGTFGSMEEIFPEGEDVRRMVLRPMEPLEPLLAAKVTEPGASAGLITKLGRGMRAFAIRTDVSSGVSGFLRPGDRVDVYWTGAAPNLAVGGNVTRLIRASVEIIAVDQVDGQLNSGARIASTVTVMVSPQDVAALAQAQATGRLTLALVGIGDDATSDVVEVGQQDILGLDLAQPAPAAPRAKICTVRTRKGAEISQIEVPCTN